MDVLLASKNSDKLKEAREIFGNSINILSPEDAKCDIEVIEDGETFEENAKKKAIEYSIATGLLTLADDSGLEVDALDGAPGVRSARYAGEEQDPVKNCRKLLEEMKGVDDAHRTARFKCSVACAKDGKVIFLTIESVEGKITREMLGDGGFGYDPIFYYEPYKKTFAQCTQAEKNAISHRGLAFRAAAKTLSGLLDTNVHDEDTKIV